MARGDGPEGGKSKREGGKSLRAEKQKPTGPKTTFDWRRVAGYVAVFALLGVVYWATQTDGGAPQTGLGAAKGAAAVVTGWSLEAMHPDGSRDELCSIDAACAFERLEAAAQANATCALRADVWLASVKMPVMLRDVHMRFNATVLTGDYFSNATDAPVKTTWHEGNIDWDNGWWWRAQEERIQVRVPVPCEAHTVHINLPFDAKKFWGEDAPGAQRVTLNIHNEWYDRLRRDRLGEDA